MAGGSANSFDAAGDRLSHTDNLGKPAQKTTSYLVDTDTSYSQVIEERAPDVSDAAGQPALQARYVWGEGLAPLAMWRKLPDGSVKLFFHLSDGQESVRQLTDTSGAVVDSYFYDAWGNTLDGSSNHVANPFRYTGQQLDADGRYYLRARFYNPGTGRFLSHDPLMGEDDDPASLHRYLYAGGDGVNACDPTGEWSLGETLVTMGVNQTLVAFGASVIKIATAVATAGNAWNIYQDYSASGTVNPWDVGFLIVDLLPAVGKGAGFFGKGIFSRAPAFIAEVDWMVKAGANARRLKLAKGALDGAIALRQDLQNIKKSLGFAVEIVTDADDAIDAAAVASGMGVGDARALFNPDTGQILVRSKATLYEVMHEAFHAKMWLALNKDAAAYRSNFNRLQREEYVYKEIMKVSGMFNKKEIDHAKWYINMLRSKP